jgi:hypothetical protein
MSLLVIDLLLVGNGYWLKWQTTSDGKPQALYRLAPRHVKIKPDKYGPAAYEYDPPGGTKIKIRPENIIHFRRPNPHSQYYGMGVIQGAGRAMDLELAITDTMASYFENKADPSLIISSERRVPRDVFKKLGAQLRSRVAGTNRAGELLVLEAGLKAIEPVHIGTRCSIPRAIEDERDRIFTKFRASPLLFGLLDESSGSNKVSDARREFDNYTLRPFLKRLGTQVTAALMDPWDVQFVIDYQQLLPPEEAIKVGESVAKIPGVKVREVRKQYEQFGIEESTGDSELDEMVLNKPMGDLGPDGQPINPNIPSGADPNLSSEPGRPPLPKNTTAVGTARPRTPQGKALDALAALDARIAEAKAVSTPPRDSRLPGEKRPDDPFAAARAADIDAAKNLMLRDLRDAVTELERGLLDTVEGKAFKSSDLVQRVRRSPAWKRFQERLQMVLEDGAKRAAASGVVHSGLEPEDEVDYDSIARTVIHRSDGLRSIVKSIRDSVVRHVSEARAANGERAEFEAAVRTAVGDWATGKAEVIADTEATHAYNEATLTAAELSGVTHVFVEDGNDHDEPCRAADGSVWEVDFAREHRLEHPNCRRAFIPMAQGAVA